MGVVRDTYIRTRRQFCPVLVPCAILRTPNFPENDALGFNRAVLSQIQALLSGDFDALAVSESPFYGAMRVSSGGVEGV